MLPESTKDKDNRELSTWLDSIQQESWQLELLISGFAVFLLLGGRSVLWELEHDLILLQQTSEQFFLLDIIYYLSRIAYTSLLVCLLVHVTIRGLWIAAVGLRSVSGDIDYDTLGYRPVFLRRLRRGIGGFDQYIERLERYCSIFFSFAFLIIFCFLSIAVFVFISVFISNMISELTGYDAFSHQGIEPGDVSGMVLVGMGLIYTVDFIALGWLKKVRWWGKTYYYLYVLMGWVTLARLYRPLYYNLIDNGFGRKFARALPVCVFSLLIISSLKYNGYAYIPGSVSGSAALINQSTYEDAEENVIALLWRPSLSSRYVRNDYVELFVPYIPINDDETLRLVEPNLVAGRNVGPFLRGAISLGERDRRGTNADSLLSAFQRKYRLYVDDRRSSVAGRFYYHPRRRQHGLLYPVPAHDLDPGEHRLRLDQRQFLRDTVSFTQGLSIYFYK